MTEVRSPQDLRLSQKIIVLVAAFLGWMFAGLQIALFVLIHRSAMLSLDAGSSTATDSHITQWFAWFQAAFLFGAASGGWIFGILGDRLGRTRALALSILCYSLFSGACWLASSPTELLILRFLSCHGIGGAWPNTIALVSEAWPAASRPLLAGLLGTAANFGQVLMGYLGYMFPVTTESWRWTFLAGAAPALIGIWCLVGVPESVRWLVARRNPSPGSGSPLRELFRPPLRRRTLIGIALGAVPVIGTAANAQWVVPWSDHVHSQARQVDSASAGHNSTRSVTPQKGNDPRSKARTMMSRSSGAVIGSLLGGILATLLGRRTTYFLISLLTLFASTFLFGWLHPLHPWFQWASFGFGLVGVIYFGWLPLYLPELFPTRVRASGTGISFNSGRAVAACVTLGTGALLNFFGENYSQIGLWTGSIYAVGMLTIYFSPATDKTSLSDEETSVA